MRRVRCPEAEAVVRAQRRRQEARQRLIGMQAVHRRRLWLESTNACEGWEGPCEETTDLEMVYPGTHYEYNGRGVNRNGALRLCPGCSHGMQSYWAEMWADYYSGTGVVSCSPKDIYKNYGSQAYRLPTLNLSGLSSYTC